MLTSDEIKHFIRKNTNAITDFAKNDKFNHNLLIQSKDYKGLELLIIYHKQTDNFEIQILIDGKKILRLVSNNIEPYNLVNFILKQIDKDKKLLILDITELGAQSIISLGALSLLSILN